MSNTDFVTQFYNLEGDLISQRKKNFFKLLRAQTTPLTEGDLDTICPRTYLENLFLIEMYMYFKIFPKLLEVLKNGNRVYVRKILKKPAIVTEAIADIPPEAFVNDFLPCVSFTVRMKLLKKICVRLGESQMDQIIFWVNNRYGFHVAVKVLHTGSFLKIKEFLQNHDIQFSSRQLKFMFNKDPVILVEYLTHYKTSMGVVYTHATFSAYVALKDPDVWLQLQNDHKLSFASLGYRTSRNFIRCDRTRFLSNIRHYSSFLKFNSIACELRGNFREIYIQNFPKDVNNINLGNFCHKLLRYYPKKKQWQLFSEAFKTAYKENISENLVYLKYGFIQQFADKTILNAWAKEQFNKDKCNYILTFCEPKMAFTLLKEKIADAIDISDKTELVMLLLENCAENEDMTALGKVLKYIYQYVSENKDSRHLYNIASLTLHKVVSTFKLEELNENHWSCINEIITFIRRKKQLDFYCFTDIFTLALKNIEYLCQHGKPFENELAKFIEDVDSNSSWFYIDLKNPKIERQIWTEIINAYPEVVSEQYKSLKRQQDNFIINIIQFNENNPEYAINLSDFPDLITHIHMLFNESPQNLGQENLATLKKVISYSLKFPEKAIIDLDEAQVLQLFRENKKDFCYESFWEKLLMKHNRSKFENDLLLLFWENLSEYHYLSKRIVKWMFLNEPRIIVPRFEHILTLDKRFIDINYIKCMSHLDFDKKVIEYCMCKIEACEKFFKGTSVKKNIFERKLELSVDTEIINILAILLPPNKFIETIVNRFLPGEDMKDESDLYYTFQCQVAKSLKQVEDPGSIIGIVLAFCGDDYLSYALPSLYSVCYRAPEILLYSSLDHLFDMTEATRRHALFLSCELLRLSYVLNMLQNANENGISGKKYVFTTILKFFRKNPSEELLNMVVENLSNIDKIDKGTLNSIAITEIPKKYTDMYIQKCWHFFEDVRKDDVNVQTYLQLVLDSIMRSDALLISLSQDFCRHIITKYFTDSPQKDHCLNNIGRFVCMFLIHQKAHQEYNFSFVFEIILEFKNNNSAEVIRSFFKNFYDFAIEDVHNKNIIDKDNNYHIELFKNFWCNMFSPIKMFDEHVLLKLLYLQCKSTKNVIESFAREVSGYLEELVAEYGPYIYYKFKNVLLYKHPFTEKERHIFFYKLLLFNRSTLNCILVIDLLNACSIDKETKIIYFQIVDILKLADDPVVAIYFNTCFGDEL